MAERGGEVREGRPTRRAKWRGQTGGRKAEEGGEREGGRKGGEKEGVRMKGEKEGVWQEDEREGREGRRKK